MNTPCGTHARRPRRRTGTAIGIAAAVATGFALCGCASTAPGGRAQLAAPTAISSFYSTIDLKLQLAAISTPPAPCQGTQCEADRGFERQVARLGARLSAAAYEADPELRRRIPEFRFAVAEKSENGSASNATGSVVVFRGVRRAAMDEQVLAYLMALEMGHVIARHHDERSAAGMISSLLVHLLLAPANLARGVSLLASSAASAMGKDLMAGSAPTQRLDEADRVALDLLDRLGWGRDEVAESLATYVKGLDDNAWSRLVRSAADRMERRPAPIDLALADAVSATAPLPGDGKSAPGDAPPAGADTMPMR